MDGIMYAIFAVIGAMGFLGSLAWAGLVYFFSNANAYEMSQKELIEQRDITTKRPALDFDDHRVGTFALMCFGAAGAIAKSRFGIGFPLNALIALTAGCLSMVFVVGLSRALQELKVFRRKYKIAILDVRRQVHKASWNSRNL